MSKIKKVDIIKQLDKKMFEYILEEDKIDFMNKDSLDMMMLMLSTKLQSELNKEDIKKISKKIEVEYDKSCLNIAKYYVKIFHLLNILFDVLNNKKEIKEGKTTKKTNNVCINMMRNLSPEKKEELFSGIDDLYHDKHLFDNKFHHMSKKNKKRYNRDLKSFIITFTGKQEIPSHISSFQDIKVTDYCQDTNICVENYLFYEYAEHLKNSIKKSILIQEVLEDILEKIICLKEKRIQLNLTEYDLNKYIRDSREYIIKLWEECNNGYTHGKRLMEKIIEDLYLKKIISEQKSIKKTLDKVYSQKIQPNDLYISEKDLLVDVLI